MNAITLDSSLRGRSSLARGLPLLHRTPATAAAGALSGMHLAKGAIWGKQAAPGLQVVCLAGSLWVTQDGDTRDVVVEAGGVHAVDRRTRVIVYALTDATFRLA